ncbi:hypothetical protein JYU34_008454 [Plutella xylostella]|uniref:Uncharacterized protein n=1 Tax=Plutella xylostella TaxID=51655 RepID=A0ABQ7QKZ1_PLUXY|nr:hypothetical protein JYU34_008454 [Plutella xylostella]
MAGSLLLRSKPHCGLVERPMSLLGKNAAQPVMKMFASPPTVLYLRYTGRQVRGEWESRRRISQC